MEAIKICGRRKAYRVGKIYNFFFMSKQNRSSTKPASKPGGAGWPSTTNNPSGTGRFNNPPRPKK